MLLVVVPVRESYCTRAAILVCTSPPETGRTSGGPDGERVDRGPRDRRTARAERTRAAIVDAHIGLLAEGVLQPTGREIASRAGVSSRSLWVHLTDLEELFTATAAETMARQEARFVPDLPLTEICASVVLAGDISLSSAVIAGDWVTSHERYGRNR